VINVETSEAYKQLIQKIMIIEKEIQEYWKKENVIQKTLNRGRKKFYFLDGPPYVTGKIHIGTAWNKVLKDSILRFKRMSGYRVWSIPGYDTHGLPIETAVEKKIGIKSKKQILDMGIDKFNEQCKRLVEENIKVQTEQFKRLCVWMDWENYYATYRNEYISRVWYSIKKAHEKGLLGEELRVFHWCPRCQTVLSEHEVAMGYKDKESPSIFVKFPLVDKEASLLIWTTTPWTLPSNTAVMVHPDEKYVLVELEDSDKVVIMEKRLDAVLSERKYKILDRFFGADMEGWRYRNPLEKFVDAQKELEDGRFVILSSEYVSVEEGSGLVHVAPSHGKEDFDMSQRYNLPIITIVDDAGRFTEKAGKYRGLYIFDADEIIIDDLEEVDALMERASIEHKYPHCWRCHTPLILRTTRQWVLYLSKLRDKMLDENKSIVWVPKWAGEERFGKWLETARDWVISRQRYWGTPAPIWKCNNCGEIRVVGSIEEIRREGINIDDLHRPHIDIVEFKCPHCKGVMKRIPDVLDVWIDSGAASWASIGYPDDEELFNGLWPVDFITEGNDQTRGWFYSLLALGIIVFDESPYKTVLMHGYALDETGRQMHKSLGNVIAPEEVLEKYGVDIFRLFVLNHPPWEDLKVSFSKLDDASRIINILFNTFEFFDLYASLDNYKWKERVIKEKYDELPEEDKWILSLFEKTLKEINHNLERYHIHTAIREVLSFIVNHLSREYIKLIRRRVWIEEEGWIKESAYHTLFYILRKATLVLAPFLPHLSEYLYVRVLRKYYDNVKESVHLEDWPSHEDTLIDNDLIEKYRTMWDLIAIIDSLRHSAGIKKRQPLKEAYVPRELYEKLTNRQKEILKDQNNVLEIKPYEDAEKEKFLDLKARARIDVLGPIYKKDMPLVKKAIEELDSDSVWRLEKEEEITFNIDNLGEIKVSKAMVEIEISEKTPYKLGEIDGKYIFLNTEIDRELLLAGIMRDIIRRIQVMRKEMSLNVLDNIDTYIYTGDRDVIDSISKHKDFIKSETRSSKLVINEETDESGYEKEWIINDYNIRIKIVKK
jgi:isoleucyl-tRNA synthetase